MQDAYDFSQCVLVLRHEALGTLTVTGSGLGTCTVRMTGDRTLMDVASDGTVMTSKVKDRRGSFTEEMPKGAIKNGMKS